MLDAHYIYLCRKYIYNIYIKKNLNLATKVIESSNNKQARKTVTGIQIPYNILYIIQYSIMY